MKRIVFLLVFCLSFSLLGRPCLTGTSWAAPVDFPKKEVTIVVNYGPGGGRDILARGLGNVMSKYLGVPVVINNMVGAGGARGLISLFHSQPDGHTMGIGSGSDITNQIFDKVEEYDNRKFTYIGRAQSSPSCLFVKTDSPFRSMKDFKTSSKPVRHSTFSPTANFSVVAMIIANRESLPLVIVAGYKSAADTALAVLRGEVEFCGLLLSSAQQYVRAGQIRPILTIGEKRISDFPNIPTVGEIGHPDLSLFTTDFWFIAPPGVPKARAQILEDALMKTLKDPDFLKWAKGADVDVSPMGAEELSGRAAKLFDLLQQYKGDIEKHMK
jgi:tripartite-type tricarboxylate transporter receptor subunit TctC